MAIAKERTNGCEVSITDVARRACVSVGTVSRVINQHPKVDPVLRRRVQIASRQLGFIPRVQHHCIALITGRRNPTLPVGYVSVMISLISQYLADSKYAVELIDIENLELLYEARTLGAIGVVFDDRLADALKIPKLPILTINSPLLERGIHSVRTDHYQQGLIATEHLVQRGHRAISFLAVSMGEWGASERLRGYRDAMSAAGHVIDPAWIQSTLQHKVYDIVGRWRARGVTGILNFSEDASLEVLHILGNILKLEVGKDISVISLEDMSIYQFLAPPQTTVSQPLADLARLAVQTMLDLCDGKRSDLDLVNISLPTRLIERDSVATLLP
jgi:LacI family transcriptional regulator